MRRDWGYGLNRSRRVIGRVETLSPQSPRASGAFFDSTAVMREASPHAGSQPDAATLVSNSVLRLCTEMKIECRQAQQ